MARTRQLAQGRLTAWATRGALSLAACGAGEENQARDVTPLSGPESVVARNTPELGCVEWTQQLGSKQFDSAMGVGIDGRGDIYVGGRSKGAMGDATPLERWDMFLVKYSPAGKRAWTRQFGSDAHDFAGSIALSSDNSVYVSGYSARGSAKHVAYGHNDVVVRRYSAQGEALWGDRFGGDQNDMATATAVDKNDNVLVVGYTNGSLDGSRFAGDWDLFVIKYDSDGERLWARQMGSERGDHARAVATDEQGNVYVSGQTRGQLGDDNALGDWDAFVVKYSPSGELLWTRQFGGENADQAFAIVVNQSSEIFVVGFAEAAASEKQPPRRTHLLLAKLSAGGQLGWTRQLEGSGSERAYGAAIGETGDIYVTGFADPTLDGGSQGGRDVLVSRYDPSGGRRWRRQFGSKKDDEGRSVALGGPGRIYVVGTTTGKLGKTKPAGAEDMFVRLLCESN